MITGEQTVIGDTTVGSAVLVLATTGQVITSLVAASTGGSDAVIEIGYRGAVGEVWFPMVGPVILPAGASSRIRLPPMRVPQGTAFQIMARSSSPVAWTCNTITLQTPNAGDTVLRTVAVAPRIRTAIFGPSANTPRWRGVSTMFCNTSAAAGLVSLSSRIRIPDGPLEYRTVAGPVLVPAFGSVRLSPFPNIDFAAETALYGLSEVAGSFHSYGVQRP